MVFGSEDHFDSLIDSDFRKGRGYERVQEYLLTIPQIKKAYDLNNNGRGDVSEWILEKYLHQISIRKGYQVINIQPFYGKEHEEFVFYTSSAKRIKDHVWIGNAYGISLYEVLAKLIVLIHKDMKYPRGAGEYKYE